MLGSQLTNAMTLGDSTCAAAIRLNDIDNMALDKLAKSLHAELVLACRERKSQFGPQFEETRQILRGEWLLQPEDISGSEFRCEPFGLGQSVTGIAVNHQVILQSDGFADNP